jgi:hypothetical protein
MPIRRRRLFVAGSLAAVATPLLVAAFLLLGHGFGFAVWPSAAGDDGRGVLELADAPKGKAAAPGRRRQGREPEIAAATARRTVAATPRRVTPTPTVRRRTVTRRATSTARPAPRPQRSTAPAPTPSSSGFALEPAAVQAPSSGSSSAPASSAPPVAATVHAPFALEPNAVQAPSTG